MLSFSANLRYIFSEYNLPDAIRKSSEAGFDAVECPWPYNTTASEVRKALRETGMNMVVINTLPGNTSNLDKGLAAIPERIEEARTFIDSAVDYAKEIGCKNIHVMAGNVTASEKSTQCFIDNLLYTEEKVSDGEINILVEPLNHRESPGYFLTTLEQAATVISLTGKKKIKIMFDCYHVQINQGDLLQRFEQHKSLIGHVQFSAIHDRGEPDHGEVNYPWLLNKFRQLGYSGMFGAEYRPRAANVEHPAEKGIKWLKEFKKA
jgi:hydroxypyruvate isomerase|tara:strand:- start:164 stop:952 length:789 start_codon:yes stop_codon:yes gene_type:complete